LPNQMGTMALICGFFGCGWGKECADRRSILQIAVRFRT
jgi:hypothetical protein